MRKRLLIILLLTMAWSVSGKVTLERCLALADENYPLLSRYGLIEKTRNIELTEINKQWLPGIGVYGQATVQNKVAEFPQALGDIMAQMGNDIAGLGRLQYRVGVDVNQTMWDGGTSRADRRVTRAREAESRAAVDVQMYAMHERVISLYFAILLTRNQIEQQERAVELLDSNRKKMEQMYMAGAAMKSDVDNLSARILVARQQLTQAKTAVESYCGVLSLFTGGIIIADQLEIPVVELPKDIESRRPELQLYDSRQLLNDEMIARVKSSLRPRAGAFVQSFYGYPGFNNFEAMMNRRLSFNILAGVKVSWSLTPFYNKKNSISKLRLANDMIANDREVFLYNSSLKVVEQLMEIEGMKQVINDDEEIINLLTEVRRAAEVQLDNGVIDTVSLLSKITDENQARIAAGYHTLKLLQLKYQLKYTLNR